MHAYRLAPCTHLLTTISFGLFLMRSRGRVSVCSHVHLRIWFAVVMSRRLGGGSAILCRPVSNVPVATCSLCRRLRPTSAQLLFASSRRKTSSSQSLRPLRSRFWPDKVCGLAHPRSNVQQLDPRTQITVRSSAAKADDNSSSAHYALSLMIPIVKSRVGHIDTPTTAVPAADRKCAVFAK